MDLVEKIEEMKEENKTKILKLQQTVKQLEYELS